MTFQFLREVIPWAIPPILGAIIGFVTNDIAIRMLFRPLKEYRLLGVRVPLTPGIFPKERHSLARSIGKMVSRELITEDALRRQIHAEKTRDQLAASLSSLSAEVLATPLSGLSKGASAFFTQSLEEPLQQILHGFLTSRAVIHAVRDILTRTVASLSNSKAREIWARFNLRSLISRGMLPLLAEENTRKSIAKSAGRAVGQNAGGLVSDELIKAVMRLLSTFVDPAARRIIEWLNTAEMRVELARHGRVLLSGVLEKLNLLQRFIVSAGQFDRKLDEKMPEIVDETIATLEAASRDPENRRRVLAVLEKALREWRDGLSMSGTDSAKNDLESGASIVVESILVKLGDEEEREKTAGFIEEKILGDGDPTLGSLARRLFGIGEDQIVEKLSFAILDYFSKNEASDLISRELVGFASGFIRDNADAPVGKLLRVDKGRKRKLDAFLTDRLFGLLDAKMPEILRGIDVEDLVVQKIDALDVRDVERLLLDVIATHLRWIDVFGAILGFLIGLIQVALKILRVS